MFDNITTASVKAFSVQIHYRRLGLKTFILKSREWGRSEERRVEKNMHWLKAWDSPSNTAQRTSVILHSDKPIDNFYARSRNDKCRWKVALTKTITASVSGGHGGTHASCLKYLIILWRLQDVVWPWRSVNVTWIRKLQRLWSETRKEAVHVMTPTWCVVIFTCYSVSMSGG